MDFHGPYIVGFMVSNFGHPRLRLNMEKIWSSLLQFGNMEPLTIVTFPQTVKLLLQISIYFLTFSTFLPLKIETMRSI